MHRRHTQFIAGALLACTSAAAGAQKVASPTQSTSVAITVNDVAVGHATEVRNSASMAGDVASRSGDRAAAALRTRPPGNAAWASIELVGVDPNALNAFLQWSRQTANGSVSPRDVQLTVVNAAGTPVMRYTLHSATPTSISGPGMNARQSQVMEGSVVLQATGITTSQPGGP